MKILISSLKTKIFNVAENVSLKKSKGCKIVDKYKFKSTAATTSRAFINFLPSAFAKRTSANSARNVRKVLFISEIQSTENPFILYLSLRYRNRRFAQKNRNRRTRKRTGQKTSDEGREQAERFETVRIRHASVCSAYVRRRKCTR